MDPTTAPAPQAATYPVQFGVDYPERQLNRLTTFFRIFTVIPIAIVLGTVISGGVEYTMDDRAATVVAGFGGALFFGPLLMILFRRKYPRWWFDWNLELQRFAQPGDRLPRADGRPATRRPTSTSRSASTTRIPTPARDLNRWLPLVKWLLAIPHYIVLIFLHIAAFVAVVIAWFAILFTGRLPARVVRLRRGRAALAEPGGGVRVHAGHRRVPAVPAEPLGGPGARRHEPLGHREHRQVRHAAGAGRDAQGGRIDDEQRPYAVAAVDDVREDPHPRRQAGRDRLADVGEQGVVGVGDLERAGGLAGRRDVDGRVATRAERGRRRPGRRAPGRGTPPPPGAPRGTPDGVRRRAAPARTGPRAPPARRRRPCRSRPAGRTRSPPCRPAARTAGRWPPTAPGTPRTSHGRRPPRPPSRARPSPRPARTPVPAAGTAGPRRPEAPGRGAAEAVSHRPRTRPAPRTGSRRADGERAGSRAVRRVTRPVGCLIPSRAARSPCRRRPCGRPRGPRSRGPTSIATALPSSHRQVDGVARHDHRRSRRGRSTPGTSVVRK